MQQEKNMIKNFAKRWFLGLGLEIPLLIVGSLAASIFMFMAKEVSFGAAVLLGFVGSGILCGLINNNYENDNEGLCDNIIWGTETKGVKFWKVFLCLLPELMVSALTMTLVVLLFGQLYFLVLNILGFTFSYWLTYWIYLLSYYGKYTCPKCHCLFCMDYVKTLDHGSGEYTIEKTHTGSGVIGGVYDSDGNRVGDVRGDTSYTTSHKYYGSHTKYVARCRYCGAEKEVVERHSHMIS